MIKIKIIQLGDTYPFNSQKLEQFASKSSIFAIVDIEKNENHPILKNHPHLLEDRVFDSFIFNSKDADFLIIIVNRPLENNYFSRRISDNLIVISTFGIEALNIHDGITIEMFVTRFIYGFATIFQIYHSLPVQVGELMQINTTGCLFDMCIFKQDVAKFFRQPKLSIGVKNILNEKTLPANFVSILEKEIKSLKIGLFFRLKEWLKRKPISTLFLTFLFGILSSLLATILWEIGKLVVN
jgi:hypothetical protein